MGPPPDAVARLRLIRSDNIGPVTYFQLLARFGSAQAAIDAIPDLAARGGGRAPKLAAVVQVEREIAEVEQLGARYLFLGQGLYPALLAELESAPTAAEADERTRRIVTDLLGPTPVPIDEIVRQAGRSPAEVQTILLELELAGRLERHAGGRVSLV